MMDLHTWKEQHTDYYYKVILETTRVSRHINRYRRHLLTGALLGYTPISQVSERITNALKARDSWQTRSRNNERR